MSTGRFAILGFPENIVIKRSINSGTWNDGEWSAPDTTSLAIEAISVQPLRPWELIAFDEGDRDREALEIFTKEELKTADEDTKIPADIIIYKNKEYVVKSVEYWNELNLQHWRSVAFRKKQ